MALLKRRTTASAAPAAPPTDGAAPSGGGNEPGKGRPTPKRSAARAARARGGVLAAPASRKDARTRSRAERRRQSQEYRAGMMSGDISRLPPRERLPERVLARDFVDTRRNVGPFFLVAAAVYFVGGLVPNVYVRLIATYLMLLGILAVAVDSIVLSRQVSRRVAEKYPASTVRVRAYSVQRALLPARWRMPRPHLTRVGNG
ncbi:DUF3043 domain-containing protein [Frankia sp. Cj3]|uniref:DUF3043 domain-containing protein n=1 Tax=Frankia sp. Cj3 TaxID=2880976 RepID=UPI001EF56B64|nr:DUF3043 domain-containing protein [Frankia sp. Cj3]